MKRALFLSLFVMVFQFSASGQEVIENIEFTHNDSPRSYTLYVPETYNGTADWPLVINYHGFTGSAADQMALSEMNSVADVENFLVAYPQGLLVTNPFLGFDGPGWNADGTLSDTDDVDFTAKLLDHIVSTYAVNLDQVYTTGWSMGSAMAFQAICGLPNQIASVAGISNQMPKVQINDCKPGRAVSALVMHGTADPIIPIGGDGTIFSAVSDTVSFWAETNNDCEEDPETTDLEDKVGDDGSTVEMTQYKGCTSGTEVLYYQINGGGHTWPGGGSTPGFFGEINQDISASTEIWNFFKRNALSNVIK